MPPSKPGSKGRKPPLGTRKAGRSPAERLTIKSQEGNAERRDKKGDGKKSITKISPQGMRTEKRISGGEGLSGKRVRAVNTIPKELGHGNDELLGLGQFVDPATLAGSQDGFVSSGTEIIDSPLQGFCSGRGGLAELGANVDLDDFHLGDQG